MYRQVATIAERIKAAMELQGVKLSDLEKLTGISMGTLHHYISGKYEPKNKAIFSIAKALKVSEIWLMGLDVPMVDEEQELSAEAQEIASAYDKLNEESKALVRRMLGLPY